MTGKLTPADPQFYEGMSARGISKELRDQYNKAWRERLVENKDLIQRWLRKFTYVTWDRWSGTFDDCSVFGWIEREDQYKDFVVIAFVDSTPVTFDTSSAKYSAKIAKMLKFAEHYDCKRVEADFNLKNVVVLGGKDG